MFNADANLIEKWSPVLEHEGVAPIQDRICSKCIQKGHYSKYCKNKRRGHLLSQDMCFEITNIPTGER